MVSAKVGGTSVQPHRPFTRFRLPVLYLPDVFPTYLPVYSFRMLIGLTGGMGCGKSTTARFFEEEGFGSIDADAVVHALLAHDEAVTTAVEGRFGAEVLSDGHVDRRALGAKVFGDPPALEWLEQLLHPRVGRFWRDAVAAEPDRDWVIQIPLLFEKKLEESFDFTVCVGSSSLVQHRRLRQRGLSEEEIARRLSRQLPLEDKAAQADFFLSNDGSLNFLRSQVAHLCQQLRQRSGKSLS